MATKNNAISDNHNSDDDNNNSNNDNNDDNDNNLCLSSAISACWCISLLVPS